MKEGKNIDELFKKRFENFEATPPPEVWAGIQSKLKKEKEDRKIIPIWWRVAGVAALIALLFTVGNFVFTPSEVPNELVVEETQNETEEDSLKDDQITEEIVDGKEVIASEEIEDKTLNADSESSDDVKAIHFSKENRDAIQKKGTKNEAVTSEEIKNKKITPIKRDLNVKPGVKESGLVKVAETEAVAVTSENMNVPKEGVSDKINS